MTASAQAAIAESRSPAAGRSGVLDVCLVYTNTNTQGRLGTHAFDLVLPPLGLAYLASALENAGYSVRIIDAFAEGLSMEETFRRLEDRCRVVGFYCHTQNVPAIIHLARRLKAARRPPHVVVGGPHATALPSECLETNDAIDCVVFGEGDLTVTELVERLLAGKDLAGVKGIYYRRDGRVAANPAREQVKDLDSLPMPAWHLLPMRRYRSFVEAEARRIIHIMGSRGCFNDCNYCHSTKMWGPTVRWHSAGRILREIDHLRANYGIEFFQFFDDVFTLDKNRVKVLMDEFRRRGLRNRWICSTRIDLLNEEIVRDLRHGGVHHVAIGIETVNDRLLKVINKNVTKQQTLETMALCAKHGLRVLGMFILGLPGETAEEALETIDFVRRTPFHFAVFSFLTVYPGTNFWHMLKDSPYLQKDYSKYNLSQNFTYVEPGRSQKELQDLMRRAYMTFFFKPRTLLTWLAMAIKNGPRLLVREPALLLEAVRGYATVLFNLASDAPYEPPPVTHA